VSKPVLGMIAGMLVGLVIGSISVNYFHIEVWIDRLCIIGSVMLISQLLGATIAAAMGKPHHGD
jgi:hypothetical protein